MSDQTTSKENIVIIRPSFKRICDNDACRAALYNFLLFSISGRVAKGYDYWYGTLDNLLEGIDESWSMGKLRQELDRLVKQGIIGQRHNEQKKWDRTLQYFFGKEEAAKLKEICKKLEIDLSSIGLPSQIVHLLNLTNAFDKPVHCICQICQMEVTNVANPFVNNGRAIPKGNSKVTTKVPTEDSKANASQSAAKPKTAKPSSQQPQVTNMPTLFNSKDTSVALTEDEQRIFDLYCQLDSVKVPPKVTADRKAHCAKLAPHVKTKEDMTELANVARAALKKRGINAYHVELGNLVNSLNQWTKEPIEFPTNGSKPRPPTVVSKEVQDRRIERYKKEIAERKAAEAEKAAASQ